jgi:hypothetical protein
VSVVAAALRLGLEVSGDSSLTVVEKVGRGGGRRWTDDRAMVRWGGKIAVASPRPWMAGMQRAMPTDGG